MQFGRSGESSDPYMALDLVTTAYILATAVHAHHEAVDGRLKTSRPVDAHLSNATRPMLVKDNDARRARKSRRSHL